MNVAVPSVSAGNVPREWRPEGDDAPDGKILAAMERGEGAGLVRLTNKRPKWDENAGGHVLNFQGRVTKSSVKNFQLGRAGDETDTVRVWWAPPLSAPHGRAHKRTHSHGRRPSSNSVGLPSTASRWTFATLCRRFRRSESACPASTRKSQTQRASIN